MGKSHLDTLTTEERMEWQSRDADEYEKWFSRMLDVDVQNILRAKKTPRHRYNQDPYKP
jgi:hypothetical protein